MLPLMTGKPAPSGTSPMSTFTWMIANPLLTTAEAIQALQPPRSSPSSV